MKKISTSICMILLLAAISACSSNDEAPNQQPLIDLSSDFKFLLTEEKFEASQVISRAINAEQSTQDIDMGNGLRASVELEEDSEPETRVVPISQGRYTIYALDGSGNRITGTDKKLTGVVNASGVFVNDAGSKLRLAPGTYTFVCISEGVTDNGTSLTITNTTKNPMLGKMTKTISDTDRKVSFLMKHLATRVRFKFVIYTESTNNARVKLTTDNTAPLTTTYDVKGTQTTSTVGATTLTNAFKFPATLTDLDTKYVLAHQAPTPYFYIQPGTNTNEILGSFVGGELYSGFNMTGKKVSASKNTPITLAANKSYTLVVRLRPLLYLFNDGSNGVLSEKGSRTPIGIVTREKTNTREGTAAGLKTSPMALNWEDAAGIGLQRNSTVYDQFSETPGKDGSGSEFNGYELTWTGTGTTDGKKRAEEPTQYPAFHWAGNYNPGVATSNIGKWYIPALGEVVANSKDLKLMPYCLYAQFAHVYSNTANMAWGSSHGGPFNVACYCSFEKPEYGAEMFDAFTNAGGALPDGVFLWTATTSDSNTDYKPVAVIFSRTSITPPMSPSDTSFHVGGAKEIEKNTANVHVLPFVHF